MLEKLERHQTCKNPLNGAKPVPGPIITIGVIGFNGSRKFDCRTNTGAQLHSACPTFSEGRAFCKWIFLGVSYIN